MKSRMWFTGAAASLFLGIISMTAQATPVTLSAADFRAASAEPSPVDRAAYRRCWRHNGTRRCGRHTGPEAYGYRGDSAYYEHDPEKLPYGSQRWWDEMLRQNRAGNSGGGGRD